GRRARRVVFKIGLGHFLSEAPKALGLQEYSLWRDLRRICITHPWRLCGFGLRSSTKRYGIGRRPNGSLLSSRQIRGNCSFLSERNGWRNILTLFVYRRDRWVFCGQNLSSHEYQKLRTLCHG